jgi:hypothetical protein
MTADSRAGHNRTDVRESRTNSLKLRVTQRANERGIKALTTGFARWPVRRAQSWHRQSQLSVHPWVSEGDFAGYLAVINSSPVKFQGSTLASAAPYVTRSKN